MFPSFLKKRGKLQPAWRYASEGVIWRIVFTSRGRVIGEARTLDTKGVSFFCLNASTGAPFWKGATFGEQWWMGIEAVCGETLLLHKYATPNMPEHKGIIAVDVASGGALWANEELTFEFGTEDFVLASRSTVQGFQFFRLDVTTGTTQEELSFTEAKLLRQESASRIDEVSEVKTPVPIFHLVDERSEEALTIRKHCDMLKLAEPVEFLEHDGYFVFNYHERNSSSADEFSSLNGILKIVDRGSGRILFDTQVHTDSPSVVPESFLVRHNMLYFVHERTTLTAIDLTNHS